MKILAKAVDRFCVMSAAVLTLLAGALSGVLFSISHASVMSCALGVLCAGYAAAILFTFIKTALAK